MKLIVLKSYCNAFNLTIYYNFTKFGVYTGIFSVLDSSGSPGPAFLWGNNYWLGSRSQCELIPRKEPLVLAEPQPSTALAWPPFPIHFVAASFRHNSTLQVHVGLPNEVFTIKQNQNGKPNRYRMNRTSQAQFDSCKVPEH